MAYTKLFNSIVTSSIWGEDDRTRIVWITLLALADKHGEVQASIPGLARVSCVPIEDCQAAIKKFLSPDAYSRTPDDEGRRIEVIDGGWHLLNHSKYRNMASKEDSLSKNAIRQKRHRDKLKRNIVTISNVLVTGGDGSITHERDIADADADSREQIAESIKEEIMPASPVKSDFKGKDDKSTYSADSRVALHFLNEQSGKRFRECQSSLEPINARLKESGVDIEGVKKMIERQCRKWKATSMEEYLRPQTLFGKEKFDSYYASREMPIQNEKSKSTAQFIDRSLDTQNEGVAEKYAGLG